MSQPQVGEETEDEPTEEENEGGGVTVRRTEFSSTEPEIIEVTDSNDDSCEAPMDVHESSVADDAEVTPTEEEGVEAMPSMPSRSDITTE